MIDIAFDPCLQLGPLATTWHALFTLLGIVVAFAAIAGGLVGSRPSTSSTTGPCTRSIRARSSPGPRAGSPSSAVWWAVSPRRANATTCTPRSGRLLFAFLALYGIARFGVTFLRLDAPLWGGLALAQWAALAFVLVGVAGWLGLRQTSRARQGTPTPD